MSQIQFKFQECLSQNAQNYIFSGMSELQETLNTFSLQFITHLTNNAIRRDLIEQLQSQDGTDKYKSRDVFTQQKIQKLNLNSNAAAQQEIEILQNYPYKVMSSVYGCNHDFKDTKTAKKIYESNKNFWYPNPSLNSINVNIKNNLQQFDRGITTITTSILDNIWEETQKNIDNLLEDRGFSFPTINYAIAREKPDTTTENTKSESKEQSKTADLKNIKIFLEQYNINPDRLVWVVDIFQAWLEKISAKKLDLNNSIAVIDGASASISGSEKKECASTMSSLQIGPYIFGNNTATKKINILKNNILIAESEYGASVQMIINAISEYGSDLSKADRSKNGSSYQIKWNPAIQIPDAEKIAVLELVKAAGDQAPIDICKKCLGEFTAEDNDILILSTGDLLAFQLAKSLGIAAFFISTSRILLSIPTCVISLDLATPTVINFLLKFKQMNIFFLNIQDFTTKINNALLILENFSTAGQITAIKFYEKIIKYYIKIKEDCTKMLTAYELLKNNEIIQFYNYIKNNINNVEFSPNELYDFLFASKSDAYEGYTYNSDNNTFSIIILEPDVPPENDDDAFKVITFCDNYKYDEKLRSNPGLRENNTELKKKKTITSCVGDNSTHIKDSPVKYIKESCKESTAVQQCENEYLLKGLVAIPTPVPKNYVYKNFTSDDGQIDEGYLLMGEIYEITYERNTTGNYAIDESTQLPKKMFKRLEGRVPLDILRNIIQTTLIDILWEIPYDAFVIPYKESGQMDALLLFKRIVYLLKTIQFGLEDLQIDDNNELKEYIKYILLGFAFCPPVPIDENNQPSLNETEKNANSRASRGKNGIVGNKIGTAQGMQAIKQFVLTIFMYLNLDATIEKVIQSTNDVEFYNMPFIGIAPNLTEDNAIVLLNNEYAKLKLKFGSIVGQKKEKYIVEHTNLLTNISVTYNKYGSTMFDDLERLLMVTSGGINKRKTKKQKKVKTIKRKNKRNKTSKK